LGKFVKKKLVGDQQITDEEEVILYYTKREEVKECQYW